MLGKGFLACPACCFLSKASCFFLMKLGILKNQRICELVRSLIIRRLPEVFFARAVAVALQTWLAAVP